MTSIGLHAVTRWHGERPALAGLDLEVASGERLAVVGPSGGGKTSLLRIIAGLEQPDSGRITFDGVDMTGTAARDRRVGLVTQRNLVQRHRRVRDEISSPLVLRRRRSPQKVTDEATHLALGDLLDARMGQLSGAQKRMASTARAVIDRPRILLLDEPFTQLDLDQRRLLRRKLCTDMAGTTIIMVSAEANLVASMADRVAVLADGSLHQLGPIDELRRMPATVEVAVSVAEPTINLVEARLSPGAPIRLSLGTAHWPVWSPLLAGQERVLVGLDVTEVHLPARDHRVRTQACVELLEPLGPTTLAHLLLPDGQRLRTMVDPGHPLDIGERVEVGIEEHQAHLFDTGTRRALVHPL